MNHVLATFDAAICQSDAARLHNRRVETNTGERGQTPLTQSQVFPFTGVSVGGQVTTFAGVVIATLPDATDDKLRVETRYLPPTPSTRHDVEALDFIASEATKTRQEGKPLLYFESAETFDGEASFTFRVSSNNQVSTTHTATLKSGNHPPRVSNLIEDASVAIGTSLTVSLEEQGSEVFSDPDGDDRHVAGGGPGDAGPMRAFPLSPERSRAGLGTPRKTPPIFLRIPNRNSLQSSLLNHPCRSF